MNRLPYPSLLDKIDASIDGDNEAFKKMPSIVKMFQGQPIPRELGDYLESCEGVGELDVIFEYITTSMGENDGFHIEGEMINQFIQAFPEMKMAWKNLSTNQKWIFIEGLYYGIRPLVNEHMGYAQG